MIRSEVDARAACHYNEMLSARMAAKPEEETLLSKCEIPIIDLAHIGKPHLPYILLSYTSKTRLLLNQIYIVYLQTNGPQNS